MQTFLPFPDFHATARCLDYRRLGKQRVEARQIVDILTGNAKSNAWRRHPAVLMWHGHVEALQEYFNTISLEWMARGYKHNMGLYIATQNWPTMPSWLGNTEFHRAHQSNLLRKLPEHYGQYFPGVPADLPYIWPSGAMSEKRNHVKIQHDSL